MTDTLRHLSEELRVYENDSHEFELSMWRCGRELYILDTSYDYAKVHFAAALVSRCLQIPVVDNTIFHERVA